MGFDDIQSIISKTFEKVKSDEIFPLINWLDGPTSK